jgi:hypothetical protein
MLDCLFQLFVIPREKPDQDGPLIALHQAYWIGVVAEQSLRHSVAEFLDQ